MLFFVVPLTAITVAIIYYRSHRADLERRAQEASDRVMGR